MKYNYFLVSSVYGLFEKEYEGLKLLSELVKKGISLRNNPVS
jgi:hypothetical protein